MKMTPTLIAAAVLSLAAAGATAQTAPARADVKKEAASAAKTGGTAAGELSAPQKADEGVTKKAKPAVTGDRAAVKAEAAAATKAGKTGGGEADPATAKAPPKQPSATTRAEVKQDAAAAAKAGTTAAGELSAPQKADEGATPKKK